jgi:hypothetical protein
MTKLRQLSLTALSILTACAIPACSAPKQETSGPQAADAAAFASPTQLTARPTGSGGIDVNWKYNATEPGGCWIEFTTPGSDFVKLAAAWPDVTTFRHPDVASDTEYIYRLLPFYGHPSGVVSATTGKAPAEGTPDTDEEGPLPDAAAAGKSAGGKKSIRTTETIAEAAPVGVAATVFSPTTVDVRWKDRAADEDGYLVEVSDDPAKGYQICALLPPDTTSFRKTHLPAETKCYFRVRAFFYGPPTPTAATTVTARPASANAGK